MHPGYDPRRFRQRHHPGDGPSNRTPQPLPAGRRPVPGVALPRQHHGPAPGRAPPCLYRAPADYHSLLERFGLADKAKQPVGEISGGQRQRLFVVLALLPNPEVVFLDELTTGLDTRARREVWSALTELKAQGLTVFLSSHYMDEVEALCDRIMILKHGSVVFSGTVAEAVETSPYDRLDDAYLWYSDDEEATHASL